MGGGGERAAVARAGEGLAGGVVVEARGAGVEVAARAEGARAVEARDAETLHAHDLGGRKGDALHVQCGEGGRG